MKDMSLGIPSTDKRDALLSRNGMTGVILSLTALCLTVVFALFVSGRLSEFVLRGIHLSVERVIPAAFPFMIVADLYCAYGFPERIYPLRCIFSHLFRVSPSALRAFICGNLSGFPIGAKICADLYSSGAISRDEGERMMALSNNPSIPFVLYAVGLATFGSIKAGLLLLFSLYSSALFTGMLTRGKEKTNSPILDGSPVSFSFVESVKRAGLSSINITSFIIIFSVAVGFLGELTDDPFLLIGFSSILEVTNAVSRISSLTLIPFPLRLAAVSFSLGFGGMSVAMQSASFTSSTDLSLIRYLAIKLLQGAISFVICLAAASVIKF